MKCDLKTGGQIWSKMTKTERFDILLEGGLDDKELLSQKWSTLTLEEKKLFCRAVNSLGF